MNQAWECPRCGRINAPFNPACFCKPLDQKISEKPSEKSYKILQNIKNKQEIINGMNPRFYYDGCFICNGFHAHGQQCITLTLS